MILQAKLTISADQAEQLKALWDNHGENKGDWRDWKDYARTFAQVALNEHLSERFSRLQSPEGSDKANSEANWQLYMDMLAKWQHATAELAEAAALNSEMKALLDQACDERDALSKSTVKTGLTK